MFSMHAVSATNAKQTFAAVIDAAQREPIVIRRQKRDVAVVVSVSEYERLTTQHTNEFKRFCSGIARRAKKRGMTEKKLTQLLG